MLDHWLPGQLASIDISQGQRRTQDITTTSTTPSHHRTITPQTDQTIYIVVVVADSSGCCCCWCWSYRVTLVRCQPCADCGPVLTGLSQARHALCGHSRGGAGGISGLTAPAQSSTAQYPPVTSSSHLSLLITQTKVALRTLIVTRSIQGTQTRILIMPK